MTHADPYLYDDAAYVLGALEDDERRAFESHLRGCPDCRARVAEVRPTADLLAGIPLSALDEVPPPAPETLLPGLLRRARRERTRSRLVAGSVGAVVAACITALVVVLWPAGGTAHRPQPAAQAFAPVLQTPVTATARLVTRAWGTSIELKCHYPPGLPHYPPYELVVTDKQHVDHAAGSWSLVPGRDTKFVGGTSVQRSNIASVQITTSDGRPILQLRL